MIRHALARWRAGRMLRAHWRASRRAVLSGLRADLADNNARAKELAALARDMPPATIDATPLMVTDTTTVAEMNAALTEGRPLWLVSTPVPYDPGAAYSLGDDWQEVGHTTDEPDVAHDLRAHIDHHDPNLTAQVPGCHTCTVTPGGAA